MRGRHNCWMYIHALERGRVTAAEAKVDVYDTVFVLNCTDSVVASGEMATETS